MPRKGPAPRRDLPPDPVHDSVLVTQLVNKVLQRGKRTLAERMIEGLCLETRAQGGVLWVAEDLGETCFRLAGARGLIRVEEEAETIQVERKGGQEEN